MSNELFPPYPRKVATVTLMYKGAPVALQLANASVQEVEKLLDGLIERAGWDLPTKEHTPQPVPWLAQEARASTRAARVQ